MSSDLRHFPFRQEIPPLTMSPYEAGAVLTAPHGLGAAPVMVHWYLENLSAAIGYVVGDRVYELGDDFNAVRGFSTFADATVFGVTTSGNHPRIAHRTTGAITTITAADWKLVIIASRLSLEVS